jgi:hypothetical protein
MTSSRAGHGSECDIEHLLVDKGECDPWLGAVNKWRRALEAAGVQFIDEDADGGPGMRLRGTIKASAAGPKNGAATKRGTAMSATIDVARELMRLYDDFDPDECGMLDTIPVTTQRPTLRSKEARDGTPAREGRPLGGGDGGEGSRQPT